MRDYSVINLPTTHWEVELDKIPDSLSHHARIKEIVDNIQDVVATGRSFYFSGDFSSGKSGAAAVVAKATMHSSIYCYWISARQLLASFFTPGVTTLGSDLSHILLNAPLLVVDEWLLFDGERGQMFETWFRERMDAAKSTIITSNYDIKSVAVQTPGLYAALTERTVVVNFDSSYNWRDDPRKLR